MYWLAAGLLIIGAICGATIRLPIFIGVLLCAATIATAASIAHGLGAGVLNAVIAVVALQVGYVAGFALRAAIRSRQAQNPPRVERGRGMPASAGEKRR
jgi:hypothetical protein